MAFLASLRSTIAYQTNGSTISTGSIYQAVSGVPVWTNTLVSSMVSIGQSTNQSYINLAQGNFSTASSWVSTLNTASTIKFVSMSGNAQTQLAVSQVSTISSLYYTSTLGTSWATLSGATGLPTATQTNYSAGAVSGDGRVVAVATNGGYLYTSNNSGASFTNTNPNTPFIYLPFETVPVSGAITNTTLTVTGSPALVTGIVGSNAVYFNNVINGSNGTQYIRGTISLMSSFTVSFWFNLQTFVSSYYQILFSMYSTGVQIYINNVTQQIGMVVPSGSGTGLVISPFTSIALNTWYNVTLTFQTGGSYYFYLNNSLITSGAAVGTGTFTSTNFSLGTYDNSIINSFNGYIDDFKIYNSAITFTPMVPANWNYVAVSNSGTYMLATAANGGLFMSSNSGSTWSQVTSELLQANWSSLAISATGQYMLAYSAPVTIQPQLTGLTGAATVSYTVNGVNWTVSASSNNGGSQSPFTAFNNTNGDAWLSNNAIQRYSSNGIVNSNAATTSIIDVGIVAGEYLQVQSSVPIVMYSFALGIGLNVWPMVNIPKTYYIIGSNDGVNWYTLQTGTTNFSAWTGASNYIIINQSGAQTLSGTTSGNITTVAGAYATNPYTYFRLIGTSLINGGGSTYMEIGEWFINFTAGGQAYSTNFGSTWQNGYALATPSALSLSGSGQYAIGANAIVPQLTGLAANTWTVNGVNWTASASSNLSVDLPAYGAFNNYYGSIVPYSWGSVNNSYSASGVYQGGISTSILGGVGSKSGEWLQLQTSVPLVMYSYTFACGGNAGLPQNYWIIGSNDGTNWYPIQNAIMAANPFGNTNNGNNFATCTNYLLANSNATQTLTGSNGTGSGATTVNVTTTNYATSGNAYTYFRIISTVGFNPSSVLFELGEWFINFIGGPQYTIVNNYLSGFGTGTATTGSVTGTITASAVSTTGQYMALVTTNTSSPNVYYSSNYGANFTGLTIGSTPMTTCAISADGSYITVSNGTTVYQLNNNSNGFSLALGNNAGVQNQGLNAIAIGNYAGQINQSANSIVLNASGSALTSYGQGFYVTPIAQYTTSSATLTLLAYGTDNQVVQHGSLNLNNTFIGYQVGNTTSPGNTFLGAYAGQTAGNVYNTCIGTQAGQYNNGAYMNTFVGYQAGQYNNSTNTAYGNTNVFIGYQAGQFNQNNYNTFIGTQAGQFNNSGAYNTFLGHTAGLNNITGNYNTFVGYNAGYNHRTGVNNTLFGYNAGLSTTTGSSNTFIGTSAGQSNTTGGGNICIGQSAGQYPTTLTTGSNNIYIGFDTAGSASGNSNEIVIGQGATGNGTNTITLGNSSNGKTILTGNVGIGTTNPSSLLHVNGTTTFGNGNGTSNSNTNAGIITAPDSGGQAYGSTSTNNYGTSLNIYGGRLTTGVWNNSNYGGDIVLAGGDMVDIGNNGTVGGSYVGGNAVIRSGRVAVNNVAGNTQTVIPGSIFFQIGSGSRNTSSSLGDYNTAMTINSSGNVGIGTATPLSNIDPAGIGLDIQGSTASDGKTILRILNPASQYGRCQFHIIGRYEGGNDAWTRLTPRTAILFGYQTVLNSAITYTNTIQSFAGHLGFFSSGYSDGLPAMTINSSGNVGIGTVSPSSKLDVVGAINCTSFLVNGIAVATGTGSVWGVNGSIAYYTSGNVGIGTINPTGTLQIASLYTTSGIWSGPTLNFQFNAGDGRYWMAGAIVGYVAANAGGTAGYPGGLAFQTKNPDNVIESAPTTKMVIDSNGNVGIGTVNPISPAKLYVYSTTAPTGWEGMGYFGNATAGFICGSYNNGVLIGGHFAALNDWVNITIGSPTTTTTIPGALSKGSGTFDIAHPVYSDHKKRLVHSFIEGPRCDLIYRGTKQLINGTITIDINKECTYNPNGAMDDGTFEALCANAECFLQNKSSFARVMGTISGCILTITCENASNDTIVWMVIAERKDSFIKKWNRTDDNGFLITQYTDENHLDM